MNTLEHRCLSSRYTALYSDPYCWLDAVQDWKAARREILARGTTADELREALDALGNKPKLVP